VCFVLCSLFLTYDELLRPSFVPVLMKHIPEKKMCLDLVGLVRPVVEGC
jgi:hypothetical protein